jgi:uncharacterized protein HemY
MLARELGDAPLIIKRLTQLGRLAWLYGDLTNSHMLLAEASALSKNLGALDFDIQSSLGALAMREGNYEEARTYLEESISIAQEIGRVNISYWIIAQLGYIALWQGKLEHARALFVKAQKGFKEAGGKIGIVYVIEGLASLIVAQNQPKQAAQLFAWTDATRETIDDPRPPVEQADIDRDLTVIRAQFDEATFAAAQARGRAMTMDEAIAYALDQSG